MKKQMKKQNNNGINAYSAELMAHIKDGKKPEEAVRISNSHIGNYEKSIEQVAEERRIEEEDMNAKRKVANVLTARIVNNHEKPEDVVSDGIIKTTSENVEL